MPELNKQEARLVLSLQKNARGEKGKAEIAKIFKLAQKASLNGEYEKAAVQYAALAQHVPQDLNLSLRAARSYQKAESLNDAARWFLEAAERFAHRHQIARAIATLKLYREVAPGEHHGPRRIFNLCQEKGNTDSAIFEFLSVKEQAKYKLRAEHIFSAFDDETFDESLDAMIHHHLSKGELLTRPGEPAKSLFVIIRGRVDGFLNLRGKHTHLGHLGSGDICDAVPYFTGGRHTSEIIAAESTDVLELPYIMLDHIRKKCPEFRDQLDTLYRSHLLTTQLALAPVFKELNAVTRKNIAMRMQLYSLKAGELLFRENDDTQDVYLVRSGAIAINLNVNMQERQFKTMKTGALVGEIDIAATGKRTSTARAIADCKLARLDGKDYQNLYRELKALQRVLKKRKKEQAAETRKFIRQLNIIEGDDTCELLLKDIWSA